LKYSVKVLGFFRAYFAKFSSTDERLDLRHGLGLLLVRQIVEAHGGTLKIINRVGCGVEMILDFLL